MKNLYISTFTFLMLFSCVSDEQYEAYNQNPKQPTEVGSDLLFNFAVKTLVDQMAEPNINVNVFRFISQYWTTTAYPDESNYIFSIRRIPQNHWSILYRNVLLDLKTAAEIIGNNPLLSENEKNTRLAQTEVIAIYTWQILVDSFGDIPYSEALNTVEFPLPAYDDAATVYEDLIQRLDAIIPNLNGVGYEIDNLYFGDITGWQKFAASLKLRLGIRLADVNPGLAKTTVESAFNLGVFESNADNAILVYLGTSNPNPIWTDIVQSGRKDFVVANTIVDVMNSLDDPRRTIYFSENLGPNTFDGGIYGDVNLYENYTQIGSLVLQPTTPALLIDYAEISFYLAEAVERGFNVGDTAASYYNKAITASFEYWGAANVADYLLNPEVAYTTATGEWRQKIGQQFWLAMYNRGFEGWSGWRTYDVPELNLPALTGNPVPTRYTYPINEQNLNETNWMNAATAIGGDAKTTKIFWDIE